MGFSSDAGTLMKQLVQARNNESNFRKLITTLVANLELATMYQAISRGCTLAQEFIHELTVKPPSYALDYYLSLYHFIYKFIDDEKERKWNFLVEHRGPGGREMWWLDKKYQRADAFFHVGEMDFGVFLKEVRKKNMSSLGAVLAKWDEGKTAANWGRNLRDWKLEEADGSRRKREASGIDGGESCYKKMRKVSS